MSRRTPPLDNNTKKQILDVVLRTSLIDIEEAKQNYITQLKQYIEAVENVSHENRTDEQYMKAIKAVKIPKFTVFDYDAALATLQQDGALVTKKQLSKFINLK